MALTGLKVAVAVLAASMVSRQLAVPEQAPLQPRKSEPAPGAAVRVTGVPPPKSALHVAPQLMPAGLLVTVPVPVPILVTVCRMNVAVTDLAASTVTTQGPVPAQAPLQPVNWERGLALGVNVTWVPRAKDALHAAPQLMPAGLLVTVPPPLPAKATERAGEVSRSRPNQRLWVCEPELALLPFCTWPTASQVRGYFSCATVPL